MEMTEPQMIVRNVVIGLALVCMSAGCANLRELVQPKSESPPTKMEQVTQTESQPVEVEQASEPAPYIHTVHWRGETLSLIAKWYTGKWRNWKALAKANSNLNPNLIRIGDKIVIPQELLKNRDPMPVHVLPSSTRDGQG